jgi:2,4-dienoyl-CoA reductase-like NADH-dependent reductase (Old Yellow Enzyme family)
MRMMSVCKVRELILRNRVVMAPMTRECAKDGVPTAEMATYYARRAAGGAALIITEGTAPDAAGSFGSDVPNFFGGAALAGWQAIGEVVHRHGAAILAQLWHVGSFTPSMVGMQDSIAASMRLSPSGIAAPDRPLGRPMTQEDIERTIGAFANAAAAARRIGFDGIEIHGAHGYLLDQFLWTGTNLRTDRYGGDLASRTRFAVELVRACREALGTEGVLSFRLSQWKQLDYRAKIADTPHELGIIVEALANAGVDLFHCSTRRYWEPVFSDSEMCLAGWVKRLFGRPTIAVGSVTLSNDFKSACGKQESAVAPEQVEDLEQRLERGEFDLIAIGRALLANANWVELVGSGRLHELKAFSRAHLESLQ